MKKILLLLLIPLWTVVYVQAQPKPVDVSPEYIMLSLGEDPARSVAVTWRTVMEDTVTMAQISVSDPRPTIKDNAKTVRGTHSQWDTAEAYAMGHKVVFNRLEPNTNYSYRVGNGKQWSEWIQFRTASDKTEPFNFIFMGDFQSDIKSLASRTIRQAYKHFPDARFMLFAGDIVSTHTREYWDEFFQAGSWIYSMMPSIAVAGNHEYRGGGLTTFSSQWHQIYHMPDNGPEGYHNKQYYFDYQGVRFIVLDGTMINDKHDGDLLLSWFEQVLESNPCDWTIVAVHQPIYPSSAKRKANVRYQQRVKPLLEKYGVDMVLQGHDHVYRRGFNLAGIDKGCKNPPMYVVSVSGPKMYGLNVESWSDRNATNVQLYQNITIDNNKLTYECFDTTGEFYDGFTLEKTGKGQNVFTEDPRVKNIPEIVEMPKGAQKNYSAEELEEYYRQYPKK